MSRDPVESHRHFKAKYDLPFRLLADIDSKLFDAFGVTARTTFLADAETTIMKVWPKVTVEGHAQEVYEALP